jgi:hypothetical protein
MTRGGPIHLGAVAGKAFYFQAVHHFLAGGSLVHFFLYTDGDCQ